MLHFTVMYKLCMSGGEDFKRYQIIKVKYTRCLGVEVVSCCVIAGGSFVDCCCLGKFNTRTTVVRTAKSFALKSNLPAEKKLYSSFILNYILNISYFTIN